MKRISTWQDAYSGGPIVLDLGDGVEVDLRTLGAPAVQDTGWRALPVTPGSTGRTGTGIMHVRRIGERVTWRFNELGITDGSGAVIVIHSTEWANGFSPYAHGPVFQVSHEAGATYSSNLKVVSSLYWIGLNTGLQLSTTRSNIALQGEFSYVTDDPWPAILPGTAV